MKIGLKVLYVFPEELAGRFAREYHAYRLAESLSAAGCEVTLAAAPSAALADAEKLHGLFGGLRSERLRLLWLKREVKLGPWKLRSGAFFYRQLDRKIGGLRPDVVFTMHLKAADYIAKRHPDLPIVFEAHEIFADGYAATDTRHEKLAALERRVYARARGVVAISDYLAKELRARYDVHLPLRVQHDGIDEAMLLELQEEPDPRELIYVGSLQPWKGVPIAVEAMRLLPEFHLTVAGGEGKKLEELRAQAPANVTFLGLRKRAELAPFLRKASLGLMPNLLEPRTALSTFPLKLLEYSAAGKGIVASRIPVFDGLDVDGWVERVEPGSAEALAAGVRARGAKGVDRRAAQEWAAQFVWARQGTAMKTFLESVLA